ncbi:DUF1963 domain-containing protein [uncultured Pseudokineococcus sp.]|uniref:DUF1963 domain-containing protein n=1 Tax=uncultured Pseudokineococcus sp. TaxID=1642928 RepID=UPI0026217054|nr:DUF1963 domain-containing protein [uncultured Pseudokineococcus sp.]
MLRSVEEPLWQEYLDALEAVQESDERGDPPARRNKANDRAVEVGERLLAVPGLLERLRALVPSVRDADECEALGGVLDVPVHELWRTPEALLADPRVDLPPGSVRVAPALYLPEMREVEDDEELLDQLHPENLLERGTDLTRLGGPPLRVPGRQTPAEPFLLQVDLAMLTEEARWRSEVADLLASVPLPAEGVLQLFHSTTGDSCTDPELPGGGASVLHLTAEQLRSGAYVEPEAADYPAHVVSASVLPTFAVIDDEDDDDLVGRLFDGVVELQRRSDIIARGGTPSPDYVRAARRDPFTAVEAPCTHLLGVPHHDCVLQPEDRQVLDERLPLQGEDRHVLLFEVASETVFDTVYGDLGRLQVWVRAEDLAAARFDDVVSIWQSG